MNENIRKEFEQKYGELHSPYVDCEIYQSDILNWFESVLNDEIVKERERIYSETELKIFDIDNWNRGIIDKDIKNIIFNQ